MAAIQDDDRLGPAAVGHVNSHLSLPGLLHQAAHRCRVGADDGHNPVGSHDAPEPDMHQFRTHLILPNDYSRTPSRPYHDGYRRNRVSERSDWRSAAVLPVAGENRYYYNHDTADHGEARLAFAVCIGAGPPIPATNALTRLKSVGLDARTIDMGGDMPIYEYRCLDCGKRVSLFLRSFATASDTRPHCPSCQSEKLRRLVSRVSVLTSEDSRLEKLADPSSLGDIDEDDPQSIARWMRRLGQETGEDLGPEFDEVVDRLEAGQSPEEIENDLPDLGLGDEMGNAGADL